MKEGGATGPARVRGFGSAGRGLAVEKWATTRKLYLENLKGVLIAANEHTAVVIGTEWPSPP